MNFKEATDTYFNAIESNKTNQEMANAINNWFSSATTSSEVNEIWEEIRYIDFESMGIKNDSISWENVFSRCLELAKCSSDCDEASKFIDSCGCEQYYCDHMTQLYKRRLDFAQNKDDVEDILSLLCLNEGPLLAQEAIILLAFHRGRELPESQDKDRTI